MYINFILDKLLYMISTIVKNSVLTFIKYEFKLNSMRNLWVGLNLNYNFNRLYRNSYNKYNLLLIESSLSIENNKMVISLENSRIQNLFLYKCKFLSTNKTIEVYLNSENDGVKFIKCKPNIKIIYNYVYILRSPCKVVR